MRRGRWTIVATVVVAAVVGWRALPTGNDSRRLPPAPPAEETREREAGHRDPTAPVRIPPGFAAPEPDRRVRPRSLRGTDVDGALVVDASGRFLVTRDAIELFDYFFVASGEESDDRIVARIHREIDRRLDPPAAAGARDLLSRYLDYRHRTEALAAASSDASIEETVDALVELRRQTFGDDSEELFGDEEVRMRVALAQREIARDPDLGEHERQELFLALEADLPEAERSARERATAPARWAREERALRAGGAGTVDLRQRRVEEFGPEVADRLASLDRRRAVWDARVASYRAARDAILADPSRPPEDREAALRDLLESRFEGPERLRMEALERIAAQRGSAGAS